MTPTTDAIIADSHRLIAANRLAALMLSESYGWYPHVAPHEQPTAAWLGKRDAAEELAGCTARRYYAE